MGDDESGTLHGADTVHAAGAVLWRKGPDGSPHIAVAHRPWYDDWSLPKGKVDPGETTQQTAVREIAEETGYACVLSRLLTHVTYSVPAGEGEWTDKTVEYFCARAGAGSFAPNGEVDELCWVTSEQARDKLTYPSDQRVLDIFDSVPTDTVTLLLVRHAQAGSRSEWSVDDSLRPLSEAGRRQSTALRTVLRMFDVERVHSAPRLRCEQTVAPVSEDVGVPITAEPLLSEEGYWPNPQAGVDRLLRIASGTGTALVSSQGGVIPDLLARLGRAAGLALENVPSHKGSVWTLTFRSDHSSDDSASALRLVTADYLPDPLTPGTTPYSA